MTRNKVQRLFNQLIYIYSDFSPFMLQWIKHNFLWLSIFIIMFCLLFCQIILDFAIIMKPEMLVAVATVSYVLLTYQNIKSNEKLKRIELDPVLWINASPFSNRVFIRKFKQFPAYNVKITLFARKKDPIKWDKIAYANFGELLEDEMTYEFPTEKVLYKYCKRENIKKGLVKMNYSLQYSTKVDNVSFTKKNYFFAEIEDYQLSSGYYNKRAAQRVVDAEGEQPTKIKFFY